MSSSSNISYADLNKINFTGGFPTSKDLAPSIIFLVVVSGFAMPEHSVTDNSTLRSSRFSSGG